MQNMIYQLLLVVWLVLMAVATLVARPKGLRIWAEIVMDTGVAATAFVLLILGMITLLDSSKAQLGLSSDLTMRILAAVMLRVVFMVRNLNEKKKPKG